MRSIDKIRYWNEVRVDSNEFSERKDAEKECVFSFFSKKCYTKLILKWWGIDDEIGI